MLEAPEAGERSGGVVGLALVSRTLKSEGGGVVKRPGQVGNGAG